jgi:LPXTG-motif cell wall-anchored protein
MIKLRIIVAAIALAASTTAVNADTFNKKTKVTFSGPVQIPNSHTKEGVVTLPAGSYIFRLLDSPSARHIVEVTNMRGDHVYSTILAVPDYRVNATSKTVMYFSEQQAGSPPPVKAWFYPGDNFGQRFVYPKPKAVQIAAAVNQPVPSHEVVVVEKTKYVEIPVYIQTPAKQETPYVASTFDKTDATDSAGVDGEAVREAPAAAPPAEAPPARLPKTASSFPFIGLMGLMLVAASFLLRRISTQLK